MKSYIITTAKTIRTRKDGEVSFADLHIEGIGDKRIQTQVADTTRPVYRIEGDTLIAVNARAVEMLEGETDDEKLARLNRERLQQQHLNACPDTKWQAAQIIRDDILEGRTATGSQIKALDEAMHEATMRMTDKQEAFFLSLGCPKENVRLNDFYDRSPAFRRAVRAVVTA